MVTFCTFDLTYVGGWGRGGGLTLIMAILVFILILYLRALLGIVACEYWPINTTRTSALRELVKRERETPASSGVIEK